MCVCVRASVFVHVTLCMLADVCMHAYALHQHQHSRLTVGFLFTTK